MCDDDFRNYPEDTAVPTGALNGWRERIRQETRAWIECYRPSGRGAGPVTVDQLQASCSRRPETPMNTAPIRIMPTYERFEICDPAGISYASECVAAIASLQGFSQARIEQVSLVVTECCFNLLRDANGGQLLVYAMTDGVGLRTGGAWRSGVEILSIQNGLHTSGTLAADHIASLSKDGMGAMQRYTDEFDMWGSPASGAVQRAVMWNNVTAQDSAPASPGTGEASVEYGAINLTMQGQVVCGDAWTHTQGVDGFTVMLVDGLGHGPLARSAAVAAFTSFTENSCACLSELVSCADQALRHTVGAALGIAGVPPREIPSTAGDLGSAVDLRAGPFPSDRVVRFCGIGNVAASVWEPARHCGLASQAGIVGRRLRKIREFRAAWTSDALLVMHSDGLNTRWDLARYPGLSERHPSLIAAVLYRDHARGNDDVTVFVARERRFPT